MPRKKQEAVPTMPKNESPEPIDPEVKRLAESEKTLQELIGVDITRKAEVAKREEEKNPEQLTEAEEELEGMYDKSEGDQEVSENTSDESGEKDDLGGESGSNAVGNVERAYQMLGKSLEWFNEKVDKYPVASTIVGAGALPAAALLGIPSLFGITPLALGGLGGYAAIRGAVKMYEKSNRGEYNEVDDTIRNSVEKVEGKIEDSTMGRLFRKGEASFENFAEDEGSGDFNTTYEKAKKIVKRIFKK